MRKRRSKVKKMEVSMNMMRMQRRSRMRNLRHKKNKIKMKGRSMMRNLRHTKNKMRRRSMLVVSIFLHYTDTRMTCAFSWCQ